MRTPRSAAFLFLVASASLAAAGCRGSELPKRARPLIGVTLLTETHAFYKDLEDAMHREAAADNFDLAIVACEMDPAKQASQIEDFITEHVDALIAAPCDSAAVVPYLDEATKASIPVFTVDIAARGGTVVSHVASDNLGGGRLAAQTLAHAIGGRGDVIIIDQPEVASVQDRTQGFLDALAAYPDVHVVARPTGGGKRANAMAVMEDMLQAHAGLKGVFAINDDTALGALSVIDAAKRTDIAIVGFDATTEAMEAIRKGGALKADIAQHPADIGKMVIDVVQKHFAGEPVPAVVAVPVSVVDQTSLAASPPPPAAAH